MACFNLSFGAGGFTSALKNVFRSFSEESQLLCFSIIASAFSETALITKSVSDRKPPISRACSKKSFCLRGMRRSSLDISLVAIHIHLYTNNGKMLYKFNFLRKNAVQSHLLIKI